MAVFKFVISDPKSKKSWQVEKDQNECPVLGKKLGEVMQGDFLGLHGFELQLTGGSDKDGFPMRADISGVSRKKIITAKGMGFSGTKKIKKQTFKHDGMRKRKGMRGGEIAADIVQINCKIVKGAGDVAYLLGKSEPAEKSESSGSEEKKEEKPEEKSEEYK